MTRAKYPQIMGQDGKFQRTHILVAEKALGHKLPIGAQVHHVNENRYYFTNENLVICQDQAYHKLLHKRMKALDSCGHANWQKCQYCNKWDDPSNLKMKQRKNGGANFGYHHSCHCAYMKKWHQAHTISSNPT